MSVLTSRLRTVTTVLGLGASVAAGVAMAPSAFAASSAPSASQVAQEKAYAQQIVGAKFPGQAGQVQSFDNVIQRESTWNPNAVNASSGAAGLGQLMKGPGTGASYQTQLNAALDYMVQRYHTPDAAWAHEVAQGWY
ncbi:transglycosylase SLT domain-containing protein [Kitasatospora sp. NPDC101176]|uniref:aggregation-promoting factor C-terminal-like domain-containing protein n=1 Tax=Kitasatospora sp. NPDC101176 TaxID=3364099 RepID=UPI00381D1A0F